MFIFSNEHSNGEEMTENFTEPFLESLLLWLKENDCWVWQLNLGYRFAGGFFKLRLLATLCYASAIIALYFSWRGMLLSSDFVGQGIIVSILSITVVIVVLNNMESKNKNKLK
jgi:hypothetical protein